MENSMIPTAYAIYLPIAIALTVLVARNLFKNARPFMLEIFQDKREIALATNRLFEIGFYLLNIGFALLILRIEDYPHLNSYQLLMERLSMKIGGFSIYLGIMLFFNLYLLFRGRKKSKVERQKAIEIQSKYIPR